MKAKRFNFDYLSKERRDIFIYLFTISVLLIFLFKASYEIYLHNPSFHMLIQSKGIFL